MAGQRRAARLVTAPAARSEQEWIIQPLLDTGLPVEELTGLLFRVAFAGIVGQRELDASLQNVVAGRPAAVQAAWIETINRMVTTH